MRQAFSYIRFSSAEQARGDSLRRQTELAESYARENGMTINPLTFHDLGISAFSGSNKTEGALAAFIKACKTGRVPSGSALLVESLDRLSREQIRKALRLLLELIDDHGIEVHTLADRRVYGEGSEMPDIMYAVMVASRANEESQQKSKRVGAAWRKKREQAANNLGVAITAKTPAWIRAEKGKPMELIKERAAIVREIFKLNLDGLGTQLIAQHLNKTYPTFTSSGVGWHKSYVEKIVRNPATYGTYIPYRRVGDRRVKDGEPVHGFFPAAIDFATFQAAQEARITRYRKRKGSTDVQIRNLFAGMIKDATLGLPMVYHWKSGELISDSYRLNKKPNRIKYAPFEKTFLRFLDQLDWTTIIDVTESEELKQTTAQIAALTFDITQTEQQIQKLNDLLLDTPAKSLKERLLSAEAKLDSDISQLDSLKQRLTSLRRRHADFLDESVVYSQLASATDLPTRARLREEIRRKLGRIDFQFSKGKTVGRVEFANGAVKYIAFSGGKIFAMSLKSE
jgi:DNA invertase Pin-like site-specific DNA recombinase